MNIIMVVWMFAIFAYIGMVAARASDFISARGINNSGDVVGGTLSPTTRNISAFLLHNGLMQDLGTLGGQQSFAAAINDAGIIVGYDYTEVNHTHAWMYSNGSLHDLGSLGGPLNLPLGINNGGQIVGSSNGRAFLFENGSMSDLGTFGGPYSSAEAINDLGQVVGYAYVDATTHHAFLYSSGVMNDIGSLGYALSAAEGINDNGDVVGYMYNPGSPPHAFLYSNGLMQDLGVGIARAINNDGVIVGHWGGNALIYRDGEMQDLNKFLDPNLGFHLESALAINDSGQLIANSPDGTAWVIGDTFDETPEVIQLPGIVPVPPGDVPEPTGILACITFMTLVFLSSRSKK